VINVENSPLRNRVFRVYLIDGNHIDIGGMKTFYFIDNGDVKKRDAYFKSLSSSQIKQIQSLKPSRLLYEFFLLNGCSKNIIDNINFFNKTFMEY
jgi:hypothetical protein